MRNKQFDPDTDSEESFAICGLLHDVCKAQFYKESVRNVKTMKPVLGKNVHTIRLRTAILTAMGKSRFLD